MFDGDRGPNTGGMGAFSPSPRVGPELEREVEQKVLLPAVREMARRGRPFRGALYAGLMLTARGPRVLEFNARLGDPTPFKSFRYREYFNTVNRMDCLPDGTPRAELLSGQIVITPEVARVTQQLADRGPLTFGISDKPDEASFPPEDLKPGGAQPIHRVRIKVVG